MSNYVVKAKELFDLDPNEAIQAEREHRHFLYLVYWNRRKKYPISVVPTKRGDKIWHAHLLFNDQYNAFCRNVFGEIVVHKPGLEEGSEPFVNAVLHTKLMHDQFGADGFDENYFGHVENWDRYKATKDSKGSGGTAGGCGSACGSGCGGGGCGGCGS